MAPMLRDIEHGYGTAFEATPTAHSNSRTAHPNGLDALSAGPVSSPPTGTGIYSATGSKPCSTCKIALGCVCNMIDSIDSSALGSEQASFEVYGIYQFQEHQAASAPEQAQAWVQPFPEEQPIPQALPAAEAGVTTDPIPAPQNEPAFQRQLHPGYRSLPKLNIDTRPGGLQPSRHNGTYTYQDLMPQPNAGQGLPNTSYRQPGQDSSAFQETPPDYSLYMGWSMPNLPQQVPTYHEQPFYASTPGPGVHMAQGGMPMQAIPGMQPYHVPPFNTTRLAPGMSTAYQLPANLSPALSAPFQPDDQVLRLPDGWAEPHRPGDWETKEWKYDSPTKPGPEEIGWGRVLGQNAWGKVLRLFNYNPKGVELTTKMKFEDTEDIESFLLGKDKRADTLFEAPTPRKLTIWIQIAPEKENARYHNGCESKKCRWKGCEDSKNFTISVGSMRVAFDERTSSHADPFHNAGYMHLYCFERAVDLPLLIRRAKEQYNIDVRLDTRPFDFDRKARAMTLSGEGYEGVFRKWYMEQLARLANHERNTGAPIKDIYRLKPHLYPPEENQERRIFYLAPPSVRVIENRDRLWSRLTEHKISLEAASIKRQQVKRSGTDLTKYRGDLAKKFELRERQKKQKQADQETQLDDGTDYIDDERPEPTPVKRKRGAGSNKQSLRTDQQPTKKRRTGNKTQVPDISHGNLENQQMKYSTPKPPLPVKDNFPAPTPGTGAYSTQPLPLYEEFTSDNLQGRLYSITAEKAEKRQETRSQRIPSVSANPAIGGNNLAQAQPTQPVRQHSVASQRVTRRQSSVKRQEALDVAACRPVTRGIEDDIMEKAKRFPEHVQEQVRANLHSLHSEDSQQPNPRRRSSGTSQGRRLSQDRRISPTFKRRQSRKESRTPFTGESRQSSLSSLFGDEVHIGSEDSQQLSPGRQSSGTNQER